jgi:hypothetical protein
MNRRSFLVRGLQRAAGAGLLGGAGLAGPLAALAANASAQPSQWSAQRGQLDEESDANVFVFPRLRFKILTRVEGYWDAEPDADDKFLAFLGDKTNLKLSRKSWPERIIDIEELRKAYFEPDAKTQIYSRPFLFMTGEGDFRFEQAEAVTLGEYFKRGGFLYADDCVFRGYGDFFFQAFLREIRQVLPGTEMQPVPHDHGIYHCFFDFPRGAPFCQGQRHRDMGLFLEDRLVAFLTAGDIHCGWKFWGGSRTLESMKMGVNIVIYSLTH